MIIVFHTLSYVVQWLLIFVLAVYVGSIFIIRTPAYVWKSLERIKKIQTPPAIVYKCLGIRPANLNEKHQFLFSQSGFNVSYLSYLCYYRAFLILVSMTSIFTIGLFFIYRTTLNSWSVGITLLIFTLIICEKYWLKLWVNMRKRQIIYDLYQLSYHLLYFADSQMNIFGKLQRCLPYTSVIKKDLTVLLLSWTQNSDEALLQFKNKVACKEAISFVDTIQALKHHQDENFYSLLRERIEEYKEQLNIAYESKRETTSYILFVLAGIPILYTFQVFIYPWVKEVQDLLLNMN